MKVTIVLISLVFTGFTFQESNKGLARVHRILGKEVYVLSEPVRDYEIVEKLNTDLTTFLAGRTSIHDQLEEVLNRGINRVEKGKIKDFDAIVTSDGDTMILIKFKD